MAQMFDCTSRDGKIVEAASIPSYRLAPGLTSHPFTDPPGCLKNVFGGTPRWVGSSTIISPFVQVPGNNTHLPVTDSL